MGVDSGEQRYSANTGPGSVGEAKYNASKATQTSRYVESLREAGVTVGPLTQRRHQEGVSRAQYRGGNGAKWKRNYLDGMSR